MSYRQTVAEQTDELARLIQLRDQCDVADFDQWVEWGNYHWEISDLTARRDALRASIDTLHAADRTITAANARCIAAHMLLTGFARRWRRNGDLTWSPQLRSLLAFARHEQRRGREYALANLLGKTPPEDRDEIHGVLTKALGKVIHRLQLGKQVES
jgi:hypothetical protein